MTIREVLHDVIGMDEPLQCLLVGIRLLCSLQHGHMASFRDCCAAMVAWMHTYGGRPTRGRLQHWLLDLCHLADAEIPEAILFLLVQEAEDNGDDDGAIVV